MTICVFAIVIPVEIRTCESLLQMASTSARSQSSRARMWDLWKIINLECISAKVFAFQRRLWTLKGTVRNSEGVSVEVTRNILSIGEWASIQQDRLRVDSECQHFGRSFTADSSKIYAFVIQNGYFEGRKVICPKGYAAVSAPNKAGFSFSKLKAELLPYGWYSWPYGPYQIKAVYCNKWVFFWKLIVIKWMNQNIFGETTVSTLKN